MELKGIITQGTSRSLTCCESITDILIDGISLYDKLEKLFNLDTEEYYNNYDKQSPRFGIKYVILDKAPVEEKSFQQQSTEVIIQMLYAEHQPGCYSEYTCGYGRFDYVINEKGHNIFIELQDSIGKYIHFII
jgi:hypothetical protein